MRDILLALFWLAAIPMALMNPAAGIAFWIWDAMLSSTELAYSFMAGVETNKIIAIATLFSLVVARDKRRFFLDRTGVLFLMLIVAATGSYVFAIAPGDLNDSLYVKLMKEMVLAFAVMFAITSKQWLYITILAITIALGFIGVKEGLIALLTTGGHKIDGTRALGDNNQLAAMVVSAIALMFAILRCTKSKPIRMGLSGAIFLSVVTVMMTFSRGGFVGLLALAFLYLKDSQRRVVGIIVLLVAAGAVVMFAPPEWFHRVDTIQDASEDGSFMGRVIAWKLSTLIALNNPIFGGGMHAVQNQVVWSALTPYFSQLDFIPTGPPDLTPHAAHSVYFEVLGDLGFTGLFIYIALFTVGLLNCRAAKRLAKRHGAMPWMIPLTDGLSWGLICYAVTGAALSIAYYDMLFIMISLSACCRQLALQAVSAQVAAPARAAVQSLAPAPAMARGLRPPSPVPVPSPVPGPAPGPAPGSLPALPRPPARAASFRFGAHR